MAKCLVTGGAGFIGSHLVDSLIDDGHSVYIFDDLSTGQSKNINPKAEFFDVNIEDKYFISGMTRRIKPDYIFHLAAKARIGECHERPIDSYEVNVQGTLYLLEAARSIGVNGFVFSSSSSVYGNPEFANGVEPITEDYPLKPISMYGLEKYNAEQLVLAYHRVYGLPTAALRYFNVYGTARQNPNGAYPNVFAAFGRDAKKGKITIYGNGHQLRDYVHVYDVVDANKRFLFIGHPVGWGQIYNVGTGETHSVNDVASYFPVEREYKEARVGDPQYSCADYQKFGFWTGWRPKIPFEQGIQIFLNSLKESSDEQS